MLSLTADIPGRRIYYATDDFVEAAGMWGVSKRYLSAAREANIRAADMVMAVTEELARHLQRSFVTPRWLPNGADLERFRGIDDVSPAAVPLPSPVVGVVGQFNSRTDLTYLEAVQRSGISLLLVGPRWFSSADDDEVFDRLTAMPGVHWVGEVPRDQLAPFLRVLAVGLTPYRDTMFNRRSYPLKTIEYLAAGVPVVASDVASLKGLNSAFVRDAADTRSFVEQVHVMEDLQLRPADIRRSVAGCGWDSRAAQLVAWLKEGEGEGEGDEITSFEPTTLDGRDGVTAAAHDIEINGAHGAIRE
jgi:glycosyltransferase involved in cell wall biosynthesis